MITVQIKPAKAYVNGKQMIATKFNVKSLNDNLYDEVTFLYTLLDENGVWAGEATHTLKGRENYVAQDDVQAVSWFRKAAELGYAPAQYRLGVRTFAGLGVARDQVQAVSWYRKAAQQGHADAQLNLGYLYAIGGNGVAKDEVEAYAYWYLGGYTEQTDLRNKLTILVEKMSPGKIAAGWKRTIELRIEIAAKQAENEKQAGK
jgi:TPR repeat protein